MQNKKEINLTEGNLLKKLVLYALPLLLSGVLQLFFNATDLIICNIFGSENSTAAISSTTTLINLLVNFFLGLSIGSNILMARCFGARNQEKGQRIVYTSMIFSVVIGVAIGVFGFFCSRYFLVWMGTTADVLPLSTQYLKIYFIGLPFSIIYNFASSILRGIGDTKRPFIYLASAGGLNVLFNLLFVVVFKMNVAGVALGTALSQFLCAIFIVVDLLRRDEFIHFKFREVRFYKRDAMEIVRIGLPAGIQAFLFSLSNVLIQSSINSLGTDVVGGSGAASSLEGFVYTSMNAIAQSSVAFVSANYGAGKRDNIPKIVLYSVFLVLIVDFAIGGGILLFRNQLLRLYVSTEEAIAAGTQRLFVIVMFYFLCGWMDTMSYALRGIGHSTLPMIVTIVGTCILRVVWIFAIFPLSYFHNMRGLLLSYPISWILTGGTHFILFIILFKRLNNKFKQKK